MRRPETTFYFHFLLDFVIFVAQITTCHGKHESNKNVAMFVFGDSVFDPGNNNFLNVSITSKADFPPYGETYFHFPTGRHCDGRVIPDFAASYAGLPYWRPYLDPNNQNFTIGTNFASAGSTATSIADTLADSISFKTQVHFFKEVANSLEQQLGETEAKELLKEAIYFSSIGGNDYTYFLYTQSNITESEIEDFLNLVIGNITVAVKEIYNAGGRKFAFQNMAPLGCMPGSRQDYNSSSCVESLQALATIHNNALNFVAEDLANELPGFKYLIYDFFHTLMDRSENPTKYGFKVGDKACCGSGEYRGAMTCGLLTEDYELCSDPDDYVFWDLGHPTEACNKQLIELLWNGTTNVTWPLNMRELIEIEIDETEKYSQNIQHLPIEVSADAASSAYQD